MAAATPEDDFAAASRLAAGSFQQADPLSPGTLAPSAAPEASSASSGEGSALWESAAPGCFYEPILVGSVEELSRLPGCDDSQHLVIVECGEEWNEASTEIWDQVDQLAQHYQSVATFVRMNMCTETEPLMKSWDVDELPTFVFLKGCRPAHKNLGVLAGEFDPHVLETTVRKLVNAPGASTSTHEIAWVFPAENIEFSVYQSTAGSSFGPQGAAGAADPDVEQGGSATSTPPYIRGAEEAIGIQEKNEPTVDDVLQGRVEFGAFCATVPTRAQALKARWSELAEKNPREFLNEAGSYVLLAAFFFALLYASLWVYGRLPRWLKVLALGTLAVALARLLLSNSRPLNDRARRWRLAARPHLAGVVPDNWWGSLENPIELRQSVPGGGAHAADDFEDYGEGGEGRPLLQRQPQQQQQTAASLEERKGRDGIRHAAVYS